MYLYLPVINFIRTLPIVLQVSSSKTLLLVFNSGRGPVFCLVIEKSRRSFNEGDKNNSFKELTRMEPTGRISSAANEISIIVINFLYKY